MESIIVFTHTALFEPDKASFLKNELNIKVLLEGETYTVRFTENGPDYEQEQISYVKNLPHFPTSLMKMITTNGQNVFNSSGYLCHFLTQLCTKTLPEDILWIENKLRKKYEQKILALESEIQELRDELKILKYQIIPNSV